MVASSFGLTNIFARTLGGVVSDRLGQRRGGGGRVAFLGVVLLLEGLALVLCSRRGRRCSAPAMTVLGILVQLSNGATFARVPSVDGRALGSGAGSSAPVQRRGDRSRGPAAGRQPPDS